MLKRIISTLLILVLTVGFIPTVSADNYSFYKTKAQSHDNGIVCYPCGSSNVTVYEKDRSTKKGTIDSSHRCRITNVYDDMWCYVKCIDSSGCSRKGYAKLNKFVHDVSWGERERKAVKDVTVYTKSDMSSSPSWKIYNGDTFFEIGRDSGNVSQVIYPLDGGGWKIGWVKNYKITFDKNGGTGGPDSQRKTQGANATISSSIPTREGYNFVKWNTAKDGSGTSYNAGSEYKKDAATTLYAQWKKKTYSIKYNSNGGNVTPSNQTKTHDTSIKLTSQVPAKTGYTFTGWKSSANSSTYGAGASYNVNANTTFTAQWSVNSYYLDLNGVLDGGYSGGIGGYGTADIYINNSLVANDVPDYYQQHPYGSKYEIKDIKAVNGHSYSGVAAGSLSGTIGAGQINVNLSFNTNNYVLDLNSILDGNNHWELGDYATADVYINGSLVKNDVSDYYGTHPYGSTYKVVTTPNGDAYSLADAGQQIVEGTILYDTDVRIALNTNTYNVYYDSNKPDDAPYVNGEMAASVHVYGKKQQLKENAYSVPGYRFVGWNLNSGDKENDYPDNTICYSIDSVSEVEGERKIVLYAIWEKLEKTASVKFSEKINSDNSISVSLSSDTPNAVISYYLKPNTSFGGVDQTYIYTDYTEPISIPVNGTWIINAVARADGYTTSDKATKKFSVKQIEDVVVTTNEEYYGMSVTLECATKNATIYYTTDGSEPKPIPQNKYTGETIQLNKVGTYKIKAYAYIESTNDGSQYALYIPSPVAESDEFEIKAVDTPQIPIDDLETAAKYANVVINCATEDAEIIYTTENINFPQDIQFDSDGNIVYVDTDGNTLKYQKYDGAFEINNSKQIKFIAYKKGYIPSNPDSEYISVCDKIVYTPYIETEKVFGGIKVSLYSETNGYDENNQINENAVDGLQIYYTTDGTDPLTDGVPYYNDLNKPTPFIINKNTSINAIAVYTKTNNLNGENVLTETWNSAPLESHAINVPMLNKPVIQVDDYDDYSRVTITAHSAADIYYIEGGEFLNFEPIIDSDGNFKISINENAVKSQTAGTVSFNLYDSTTIKAIAVRKGYGVNIPTECDVLVSKTTPPSVTTLSAEDISENSAVLYGEITHSGGYDIEFDEVYNRKFQIFEVGKSNQMYTFNVPTSNSSEFSITADILRPNTKYQYRASAENDKGFSEGEWVSFTTSGTTSKYPESIEIEPSFLSMTVGTKRTVLVKVLPENAENRNLAWISSNPEVAVVNKNGQITAISKGETTIKAISANRIEGSLKLSVVDSEINGEFDFSEINMAKNIGSWNADSKLGYALDTIQVGGNSMMATAYLSRWSGPIKEESDPYPSSIGDISTTQLYSDYHVQEVLFLPPRKDSLDNDDIKRAIMKYGAVYTQFYNDRNYKEGNNIYIPEEDSSTHKNPHAVAIIGWDDNYDYENFSEYDTLDGRNGAFICKNSNGSKDEYLYISYYDKYIARGNENAVFNNLETNTNYNTIYQYDPLGPTLAKEFETTIYMANAFPREGETLKQQEELKAVSFYTGDKGISYEIYAITDFGSNNNFDVGSGLGECLARGIMDYAGYHTVQLDKSVNLMAGTRFAVIVKLSSSNGNVMTYVEAPFGYAINAFAKKGDSFIKEDNGEWLDYNYEYNSEYSGNTNLCIKAFTNNPNADISLMSVIDNSEINTKESMTVEEALGQGYLINEEYIEYINSKDTISLFSETDTETSGAIPQTIVVGNNSIDNTEGLIIGSKYDLRDEGAVSTVKNQGKFNTCWAFATYASLESCLMKKAQEAAYYNSGNIAGSSGMSGTDAAVLVDTSEIDAKSLILNKTSLTIAKGNTEILYASTYPENATNKDVVWSSNDINVVKVDTNGKVYAINIGNAKITATHVKTGLTRVCTIKVTEPLAVTGLENVSESLSCEVGENIIIHYDVMPTNAGNKEIIVEIEDESIATSSFSMLTGVRAGETTVTISTVDGGYSKTIPLVVSNNAEQETAVYDLEVKSAEISENSMCAEIYNNADVDITSTIYIAVYNDVTHKLENIISDTICIPAKDKITFDRDISISGNSYVKIFLWDSSQQLKPLAKAYMIDAINSYDISVSDVLTDVNAKTISATVKNSDSELLTDAVAYVAVYDRGKLLEVQQCEISSLDVGATKNITATFETTDINDYKIFVWDTTLKPLSLVTE